MSKKTQHLLKNFDASKNFKLMMCGINIIKPLMLKGFGFSSFSVFFLLFSASKKKMTLTFLRNKPNYLFVSQFDSKKKRERTFNAQLAKMTNLLTQKLYSKIKIQKIKNKK